MIPKWNNGQWLLSAFYALLSAITIYMQLLNPELNLPDKNATIKHQINDRLSDYQQKEEPRN